MIRKSHLYQLSKVVKFPFITSFRSGFSLLILSILLQFFVLGQAQVWAQGFETPPKVIDDADDDSIFSPNSPTGDGVQDKLLISFVTDGSNGDFQITIDVHSPGGIGDPDGKFDVNDDWVATGKIGPGVTVNDAPKIIRQEWDGKDRSSTQKTPPTARLLKDGNYQIRVEIDAFQNGTVNVGELGYTAVTRSATIDTTPPQLSASVLRKEFSPNGDGVKDTTSITYNLSEDFTTLQIEFANLPNQPVISLTGFTKGSHTFDWNGGDGLGTPLQDGTYTVQLRGRDKGGNSGTFVTGTIQIDTEPPTISKVTPSHNSFQSTPIKTVDVTFNPGGGSPIDFNAAVTKITLKNANGTSISGSLSSTESENRVTLTLDQPLDTSDENGVYTITADGLDKAGNAVRSADPLRLTRFTFDTVAPVVTKVTAEGQELKLNDASVVLPANGTIQIEAFDGTSGIDFSATNLTLTSPTNQPVVFTRENKRGTDEKVTMILNYGGLQEEGTYALQIASLRDLAGNTPPNLRYPFRHFITPLNAPTIVSTVPRNEEGIHTQLTFVEAVLQDNSGAGLNLNSSTIRLSGPKGEVAGTQSRVGENRIRWTLATPLATDGSADGMYTITVEPLDNAGNPGRKGLITFVYDTQVPQLVSLGQINISGVKTFLNSALSLITATFDDQTSGLNFNATTIDMVKLAPGEAAPIVGTLTPDENKKTLEFRLTNPLEVRNGSQDGVYRIRVTFADKAGNSQTKDFEVIYDTQVPTVRSTAPAIDQTVSSLSQVSIALDDATSGVDFGRTQVKLLLGGNQIGADVSNNGTDTIRLTLAKPLAIDGSDDGEYTIEITPVDVAGNTGSVIRHRFFFATKTPEIRLNTPAGTRINSLATIEAQLFDYVGSGIDFSTSKSTILVKAPDGLVVTPKEVTSNAANLRLIWTIDVPLSRNGSADGQYTASVRYEDFAGRTFTKDFALTFDTQIPTIASTTPAAGERVSQLSQVVVKFNSDLSGVDLPASQVRLLSPSGTAVGTNRSDNGVDTITLRFNPLRTDGTADGVYTIEVTPADRAGNVAGSPLRVEFTYSAREPRIELLTPTIGSITQSPTVQLDGITAALQNYVGPGINFNAAGTTITVTNAAGAKIASKPVENNGSNQLIWTIASSLPRDGSADGVYTVDVGFVDKVGTTFRQTFTLTLDTLTPTIVSTKPAAQSRVSALNSVTVTLQDNLSGVDLTKTSVRLVGPGNVAVPSEKLTNGSRQITLSFNSLKTDGTADGVYRIEVTSVDLAGNTGSLSAIEFTYATQVPEISTLTPADNANVNRVQQVQAVLIDRGGKGIDFDLSKITLKNAAGAVISGGLKNDGKLTLTLEVVLPTNGTADGVYTTELHLVDKLGTDVDYTRRFTYDSQPPVITAQSRPPADNTLPKNLIEVEFEVTDTLPSPPGRSGSGVDFAASTVQLVGPNNATINGKKTDDGLNKITFKSDVLPSVGTYTLSVTLADFAGNSGLPQKFKYDYRIDPPRVVSISPSNKAKVNRLNRIVAKLEDFSGSGINFSSTGSTVELRDSKNLVVDGDVQNNGVDEISLTVKIPLLTDGSEDGVYTVTVQPVDNLGTIGPTRQFTITYDTLKPVIQAVSHIDFTANVSNVSALLTRVEATLSDNGTGIDFDQSSIQLLRATEGEAPDEPVAGTPDNDNNAKIWWQLASSLSRSGDADGLYSIRVKAVDKAGNIEDKTFALRYDTQVPTARSIRASQVDGTTVDILTSTLITSPINQIAIEFFDGEGSGIDLSNTTVRLVGPSGSQIGANQKDDGANTVFLSFNALRADGSDDGLYRLQVTPTDRAGNTFTSPVEFRFFYGTRKPEIVSTAPAEFSFATQLTSVSVMVKDHSGEGIDTDKSTIRLQRPDGAEIAGRQLVPQSAVANQSTLTWELNTPPSRDGQADGEYTIRLKIIDKAGNLLDTGKTFVYDTLIPRVVSVTANTPPPLSPITVEGFAVINQSFTAISIKFSDVNDKVPAPSPKVSGVDLVGTNVRLLAGNNQIGINARDDGVDTITISFAQPPQPGTYTIEITPRDLAGNVSGGALQYKFSLELARPSVSAVTIGGRLAPLTFVNRLDEIVATLVDTSGAGLNLTSNGSTIAVTGPKGVVEGIQISGAPNSIRWTPLHLATDGSADGIYTVTVTPVDSAGRTGTPSRNQVTFDTQQPDVVTVTPINLAQPASYIGQQITQITAQVADVGPAGLEIGAQTIQLRNASGGIVPADLTNDSNNRIFLTLSQPLATNGSNDGEYTVIINLTDKAGNTKRIEHRLVYDTQAPTLVSTDPADGTLRSDDITLITANLADKGSSGIDFATSQLTLLDANGNSISGKRNNDGRERMTLQINGLATDGNYTIRILAIDRAGNGANAPFEARFLFSSSVPVVASTVPVTTPAEKAFTNKSLSQVEVELQSEGGGPNRSSITLLSPNGTAVPGQQIREDSRLIYRLSRELASDGSDDGTYTISVTPVNSAGRQGTPQQFTFSYDTVPPEVDTATIQLIVVTPGVNNSLNEIHAIITDKSPSSQIDWEHIDGTWLTLEKVGTVRKISGTLSSDKQQTLTFRLTTPLASDGSQDGQYRLTLAPKDRAGNIAVGVPGGRSPVQYEFFYDTKPPIIDAASLVINDQSLLVDTNDPDYPSAANGGSGVVIKAKLTDVSLDGGSGLGADLARSSITLRAPDGNPISGLLKQNGTDGIEFKSGPLTAQGLYQVTITSVGLDSANLGFHPTDSLSTKFLYETTKPTAKLTSFGGNTILEDEPIPLTGTASDPASGGIPASGVVLVEIIGTGPDGKSIEPVITKDDSEAKEEPWSRWSLDFLPSRSGEYNLDIRVTDRAGNSAVVDAVTVKFSVSLTFKGSTYVWPNPVRRSNGDLAHFSFDVNVPGGKAKMTLRIYDFAGDLVYEEPFDNIGTGRDNDQLVTWNMKNQSGTNVARGVYIFRLEAEDTATNNRTNVVGKILVVE